MPNDRIYRSEGFDYVFTRRRYSNRTFTWLNWRKDALHLWNSYGDPWPKVRLSKSDLSKALADIKVLAAREVR